MLPEIDRRTEGAHDLVVELRRYRERGRPLPKDAARCTVDPVRSRPHAVEHVGHERRLWHRVHPPTGREGPVPFVFADTTGAKAAEVSNGRRGRGDRPSARVVHFVCMLSPVRGRRVLPPPGVGRASPLGEGWGT
ncbi:hypothetical protein [Streptomyces bikiniensis]|uniref:hypothetical protein n=1 Tax=Streptomyces bikiniensis TaxID=1896 RepID=UPI000997C03D|nr:hypothetical protein [Streptomyces bikiniensis]